MFLDFFIFPIFIIIIAVLGSSFIKKIGLVYSLNDQLLKPYATLMFGLFYLGFISLIFNFFSGVNNSYFFILVTGIFLFSCMFLSKKDVKQIRNVAVFSILFVPLVSNMPYSYDGGLYHLPHQNWIREKEIVFGLANFHGRFGFSSFQEYIQAPLWINNSFKLLSYYIGVFLISFLVFIYYCIVSENHYTRTLTAIVALNLLIFSKYLSFQYTSTDTTSGLLFIMTFILGVNILINFSNNRVNFASNINIDLFVFLIFASMTFALKASTLMIGVWAFIVIAVLVSRNSISILQCIKVSSVPLIFITIWLLKGIITTGCLLYPLTASCIQTKWSAYKNAAIDAQWITAWARHPRSGLSSLENWNWLSTYWIPAYKDFIIMILLSAIVGTIVVMALKHKLTVVRKHIAVSAVGLSVIVLSALIWFFKAPDPRFGSGIFALLFPLILVNLLGIFNGGTKRMWHNIAVALVVLLTLKFGNFHSIEFGELTMFDHLTVPKIEVMTDPNFGVRPLSGDQCWLIKECSPYDRPNLNRFGKFSIFYN